MESKHNVNSFQEFLLLHLDITSAPAKRTSAEVASWLNELWKFINEEILAAIKAALMVRRCFNSFSAELNFAIEQNLSS